MTQSSTASLPAGLFTRALANALTQPGLDLIDLATIVTRDVERASKGLQQPEVSSKDVPRFYFLAPVPLGVEKMNGKDRSVYIYVPAGTFWMGCTPGSEAQCERNEKPRHLVDSTHGYWLGQTEVTNTAFTRYAIANGIHRKPRRSTTNAGKEGDLPVVSVTWEQAQSYCHWVAKGGRLPTEAEWERAARDGRDDETYPFPDVSSGRLKANFNGKAGNDIFEELAPVKQFDPSRRYKLYDMAGNVWEWVSDWFSETYYEQSPKDSPVRDPKGPAVPEHTKRHVARGGSWASDPQKHLRISYRFAAETANNVGLRCLLPDTPEVQGTFRN